MWRTRWWRGWRSCGSTPCVRRDGQCPRVPAGVELHYLHQVVLVARSAFEGTRGAGQSPRFTHARARRLTDRRSTLSHRAHTVRFVRCRRRPSRPPRRSRPRRRPPAARAPPASVAASSPRGAWPVAPPSRPRSPARASSAATRHPRHSCPPRPDLALAPASSARAVSRPARSHHPTNWATWPGRSGSPSQDSSRSWARRPSVRSSARAACTATRLSSPTTNARVSPSRWPCSRVTSPSPPYSPRGGSNPDTSRCPTCTSRSCSWRGASRACTWW
mmetsp:Transcript_6212/g.26936  ORF Transcript_6212/g.26936 Transcript_6212/m.26936 type:complete len:275 (-) Transcript_6212:1011-1835(-)